jgi:hypothetical protein
MNLGTASRSESTYGGHYEPMYWSGGPGSARQSCCTPGPDHVGRDNAHAQRGLRTQYLRIDIIPVFNVRCGRILTSAVYDNMFVWYR